MKVLIADDNHDFCTTIAEIVRSYGHDTHTINNPEDALTYLDKFHRGISLILLDIEFGPEAKINGLDVLDKCRHKFPAIPVVMISGKGTIETAVKATKLGAINFIEKSIITKERLKDVIKSAANRTGLGSDANDILHFLESHGIIGKSRALIEVGDNIIRFGRTDLNILITGDTGTGKKLAAHAIHAVSRRLKGSFVTVDIPNIPKDLFQSELFGHVKGAFSGATESKRGLFHQANKGTLFLDEIGDLSLDLQSNLFIPIEEKVVRRVGSVESEEMDVRFISATDRDLVQSMKDGKFREQLYHRLRECEINIPPIKERREDIPLIIEFYVKKHNVEFDDSRIISSSAIEYMQELEWDGNIRELSSVVRVALQTVQSEQIEVTDISRFIRKKATLTAHEVSYNEDSLFGLGRTLKEDLAQTDRKKIEKTLKMTYGNVSKAAAALGVSRETLHNKIRRYGINVTEFRGV
ncbi:MAG: sigma-54 dependent transcriptional regulator [Candidatus Kapabacteria bacterium]|nr:sigma-54 dependent transcriptional regulator [Candidatus Kapabacteria bacterium]